MNDTRTLVRFYLTDPGIAVHIAICCAALFIAINEPSQSVALAFALGWVSYVIQEHIVHRLVFHAPAPRAQWAFDLIYRLHYGHHDQVQNRHLLFTPLWFSVLLGITNFVVVSHIVSPRIAVVFVYGGGVAAYLLFEWMHLLSHFNACARGRLTWAVTRKHARHHFTDFNKWFTVSPGGGLVDKLFGAGPQEAPRVLNTRTCGLDPDDKRFTLARERYGSDRSLGNFEARRVARKAASA